MRENVINPTFYPSFWMNWSICCSSDETNWQFFWWSSNSKKTTRHRFHLTFGFFSLFSDVLGNKLKCLSETKNIFKGNENKINYTTNSFYIINKFFQDSFSSMTKKLSQTTKITSDLNLSLKCEELNICMFNLLFDFISNERVNVWFVSFYKRTSHWGAEILMSVM